MRARTRRAVAVILLVFLLVATMIAVAGCGGGGSYQQQIDSCRLLTPAARTACVEQVNQAWNEDQGYWG